MCLYYRASLFKSVKNFLFVGVAPLLGALTLAFAFGKSAWDGIAHPDETAYLWFGLAPSLVIGVGLILLGIPLMLLWWAKAPTFFKRKHDPLPHPEPDGTGAAVPALSGAGTVTEASIGTTTEGSDG